MIQMKKERLCFNYSVINRKKLKINGFSCKKKSQLKALKNINGDKINKVEKIFLNKTKKKKKIDLKT